jgi:hypothetical protein
MGFGTRESNEDYTFCRKKPICSYVYSSHGVSNLKLRLLVCFTLYLLNGSRVNLRAIDNCIYAIHSIELKQRSIFMAVYIFAVYDLYDIVKGTVSQDFLPLFFFK